MISIDTCGSFEPVVFTIGSNDYDDGSEDCVDHHSEVSCAKSAEEFCFIVANSGKSVEETNDIVQSYYKILLNKRERLLTGLNEKEQKLSELQLQKQRLNHIRDQIESTVRFNERRVLLLSEENFKRCQTFNKCQKYEEVLQNLIKQVTVQNQSTQTTACNRFRQCYLKLKKHTHTDFF